MGFTRSASAEDVARTRRVRFVLWAILGLNLAVAAAKYFYGLATASIAMQADGFHSLFDGTSNVVGLIGLAVAVRPPDRDHPYGHAKYETYAAAIIGAMLLLASWKVGAAAWTRLANGGEPPRVDAGSFVVMLVTLGVNIGVAAWERRVGKDLRSELLIADASHTGSDILVSVGVLAGLVAVWLASAMSSS
ncbi:MAG TPA: cation diffusion facilitator family transporter, partial [Candidatus Methanoperedens sp.]|nr:cation diffusion facilitator family transporter [Candidatus Methanoperedens sp.]